MLLSVENISLTYVDKIILNEVNLYIEFKEKIGLIGDNGSGKTSLLKIIAGLEEAQAGKIIINQLNKIAYLPQDSIIDSDISVIDFIQSQNTDISEEKKYEMNSILTKLGIFEFNKKMGNLSGGEKKRVMLAATLVKSCELLILDEPTNHLDIDMINWLEKYLIKYNKAILLVTHDRYFLERVVGKIVELDNGILTTYEANYNKYLEQKLMQEDILKAQIRKKNSFLRKEYEWIKRGPQARETKDKRRIKQYEDLVSEKQVIKDEMDFTYTTSRLGKKTIILEDISKSINNRTLIKDFTYIVENNDRVGIIGRNGIGKSTLLNIIAGDIKIDSGILEIGETVKIGYFKQEVEAQNPKMRVIDYLTEVAEEMVVENISISASKMLERFLFTPQMQYSPIEKLSGGERRRLYLLKILMQAPNILLLDEPTNDLDITTLSILEDFISSFEGAVLIVSHDRYFLDRCVEKLFYLDEEGIMSKFNGAYTENVEAINDIKNTKSDETKKTDTRIKPKSDKLTYNEKRELSTIEVEVNSLDEALSEVTNKINSGYLEYEKLAPLLDEQKELEQKLNDKLERWAYLTEKEEKSK